MDDFSFDFERTLEAQQPPRGLQAGGGGDGYGGGGGEPKPRNYRQTVCTYWLRGLCMKGDTCGFLHEFNPDRMPVCRTMLKNGVCKEPDCPYKHTLEAIKECNMYKLGFCIYGPACRFKHTRQVGPPPDPETLEAAKPREARNLNIVANQANENIMPEREFRGPRRPRGDHLALEGGRGGERGAIQQYGGPGGGRGGGGSRGGGGGGAQEGTPGFVDPAFLASVGQQHLKYGF